MSKPPLPNQSRDQERNRGVGDQRSKLGGLLRRIEGILTAEDASIKGLANAAGLDPKRDFRGIYLNGLPLADQDISGFDFSRSDLRNTGVERAKRDGATLFEDSIFDGPSLDRGVILFNRRLRDIPFSELELQLNKAMESGKRRFDVISFTTAMRRAPRMERAEHWYEEMKRAGVTPNEVTFSTLISKAASAERAEHWYEEMKRAGVAPNEVTFNTLISKGVRLQ